MQPAWSPDRMEGPSRSARRPPVWPSCRHAPTYGVVRTNTVVVTTRLSPMALVLCGECRRLWWYHLSLSVSRSDSACALSWQSPVCLTSCKAAWEASLNAYVLAALLAVGYGPTGDISPHTRISHLLGSILKAVGRCPERQKSGHPLESCIVTYRL